MPYTVTNNHPDCQGWALVKDATNEVVGCHKTQSQAEDQLTAINISEFADRSAEIMPEIIDDKKRYNSAMEILKELQKEV
jgi:hypothetical protein